VHEVYAAEMDDATAAAGFALALATCLTGTEHRVLWLRTQRTAQQGGVAQANGWAELGGTPGLGLVGVVCDTMTLLRAAVDALRCTALGAVVVENRGAMRELDLTASRRLTLAAEKSGVPLLLLRSDAAPVPSAAQTRWQVAAAPSHALPGNAPGWPTFDVTLLRQRSGPCGLDWRLEWDRDQRLFREAALSGAVVSVPAHRPVADRARDERQDKRKVV
jgi:protein ImuA